MPPRQHEARIPGNRLLVEADGNAPGAALEGSLAVQELDQRLRVRGHEFDFRQSLAEQDP